MVVPHLRGQNAIFQHYNARPNVESYVLTFLNKQSICLLHWPAQSPDMSPVENIWLWVFEKLVRHPSLVNMVDEV